MIEDGNRDRLFVDRAREQTPLAACSPRRIARLALGREIAAGDTGVIELWNGSGMSGRVGEDLGFFDGASSDRATRRPSMPSFVSLNTARVPCAVRVMSRSIVLDVDVPLNL